ncbi:hypothetical protein AB4Y36_34685 [Paraburkholderia sp. BR10936]
MTVLARGQAFERLRHESARAAPRVQIAFGEQPFEYVERGLARNAE